METYVFSRIASLDRRFNEVDILIQQAEQSVNDDQLYSIYCRAAHIILVAHFEGSIKEICKDIIDDINKNLSYNSIPDQIFATYCDYFLLKEKKEFTTKSLHSLQIKLRDAFGSSKAKLKVEPFLLSKDKNPAPAIINSILERFGVNKFFRSLTNSDLDVVFQDSKTEVEELRTKLKSYVKSKTSEYPFEVARDIYTPDNSISMEQNVRTMWEEFIDDILKERHSIVHGQSLVINYDHKSISVSRIKIEIIIYVFIINICIVSNPKVIDKQDLS